MQPFAVVNDKERLNDILKENPNWDKTELVGRFEFY